MEVSPRSSLARRTPQAARAPQLGLMGAFVGVLSIGMTNRLRKRGVAYQPWLHVIAAGLGIYLGRRLGDLYDDVTDVAEKQLEAYRIVPSWAFNTLSPAELETQLKRQRLQQLHAKFAELSEAEEADFQKVRPSAEHKPGVYFR